MALSNMKNFVVFKNANKSDMLGSDGTQQLDGRKNLSGLITEANRELKKLQRIKPSIKYYEIRKGNMRRSSQIYKNY